VNVYWHLIGRAAHRQSVIGPVTIDAFKSVDGHALPVAGDLVVMHLEARDEACQLRVKRRRFDLTGAAPELHIDVELVSN
jgi:hypothetical protein